MRGRLIGTTLALALALLGGGAALVTPEPAAANGCGSLCEPGDGRGGGGGNGNGNGNGGRTGRPDVGAIDYDVVGIDPGGIIESFKEVRQDFYDNYGAIFGR